MQFASLGALALMAASVQGYRDTSPFFMFSTSEILLSNAQLQSASSVTADVSLSLSQCPTDYYIVIYQPDYRPSDFSSPTDAPVLSSKFQDYMTWANFRIGSRASIADVVGQIDINSWRELLEDTCGASTHVIEGDAYMYPLWQAAKSKTPLVLGINLPSPSKWPEEDRKKILRNHDRMLGEVLKITTNYTVLYTTTPEASLHDSVDNDGAEYEMESTLDLEQEPMHVDLKRDLRRKSQEKRAEPTLPEGPLFQRYQFLNRGIFMGFTAGIILLLILYVGISGLASLQVSYAAFEKESGPLAGKKSQ